MEENTQPKSRDEWFALVKAHEESKQSQIEFCKIHNIKPHQLAYYKQQYQLKFGNPKAESGFTSVVLNEATNKPAEIKIVLPNGFSCWVPSNIGSEHLKKLLGAILSC